MLPALTRPQAAGSPACMPTVNHFWRDADEPCVKVSGETRPRVAR